MLSARRQSQALPRVATWVALDAANGQLLGARQVGKPSLGETLTMAPLVFEDLVIIGPAGSENNVQGWIGAFHLADGTPAWRFNTIPRPGETGSETWKVAPGVAFGGGGIWTSPSLDAARGELYVAVANPPPTSRPTCVRARTGTRTRSSRSTCDPAIFAGAINW